MNKKTKSVTRYALCVALVFVGIALDSALTATADLKMAVASLLVVLPLCQIFTWREALVSGLSFGLLSMLRAYVLPGVTSQAFMNPLVAVLPRVVLAFVAYFLYKGLFASFSKRKNAFVKKYLASGISAACGVVTNTVLVITFINVVGNGNVIDSLIKTLLAGFAAIELGVNTLLVPVITNGTRRALKLGTAESDNNANNNFTTGDNI